MFVCFDLIIDFCSCVVSSYLVIVVVLLLVVTVFVCDFHVILLLL